MVSVPLTRVSKNGVNKLHGSRCTSHPFRYWSGDVMFCSQNILQLASSDGALAAGCDVHFAHRLRAEHCSFGSAYHKYMWERFGMSSLLSSSLLLVLLLASPSLHHVNVICVLHWLFIIKCYFLMSFLHSFLLVRI